MIEVYLKTYITDFSGVHEARFLATVDREAAWHYVSLGWADYVTGENQ